MKFQYLVLNLLVNCPSTSCYQRALLVQYETVWNSANNSIYYVLVEGSKDVWYPSEKIAIARRKLEGAHPRTVTEEELSSNLSTKPHLAQLLEMLCDDRLSDMPSQGLSTRQQVSGLL